MTALERNQYKTLALACVIWLPLIVWLSPPMNTVLFFFITAFGAWFSKGSVEVSYHYNVNFEQDTMTCQQLLISALLVPFWFWLLKFRKPY